MDIQEQIAALRAQVPPDADLSYIAEDLRFLVVPIDAVSLDPANAREHDEKNIDTIRGSLRKYRQRKPLVANAANMTLEAGNGTWIAGKGLGWAYIAVVFIEDDPITATGFAITDNRASDLARWNQEILAELLDHLDEAGEDMAAIGWTAEDMVAIAEAAEAARLRDGETDDGAVEESKVTLHDRFIVPPFSVLDSRQGYWLRRKRVWINLGIRSELGGRDDLKTTGSLSGTTPNYYSKKAAQEAKLGHKLSHAEFQKLYLPDLKPAGTMIAATESGGILSIFDPVLCELVYRWFCPPGGRVLDSYAGGSVRGIVAAVLGRPYVGIELRLDQIEANEEQAKQIKERLSE